jgi:hypothetical protein
LDYTYLERLQICYLSHPSLCPSFRHRSKMHAFVAIAFVFVLISYFVLQFLLHHTQNKREPPLLESTIPFLDSAIGILKHRANYLGSLRYVAHSSLEHTLAHTNLLGANIRLTSIPYGYHSSACTLYIQHI